jgi:hypothetical protein
MGCVMINESVIMNDELGKMQKVYFNGNKQKKTR